MVSHRVGPATTGGGVQAGDQRTQSHWVVLVQSLLRNLVRKVVRVPI